MMIPSYFLCVFFAIVIGIIFIILYHWLFMVIKKASHCKYNYFSPGHREIIPDTGESLHIY